MAKINLDRIIIVILLFPLIVSFSLTGAYLLSHLHENIIQEYYIKYVLNFINQLRQICFQNNLLLELILLIYVSLSLFMAWRIYLINHHANKLLLQEIYHYCKIVLLFSLFICSIIIDPIFVFIAILFIIIRSVETRKFRESSQRFFNIKTFLKKTWDTIFYD